MHTKLQLADGTVPAIRLQDLSDRLAGELIRLNLFGQMKHTYDSMGPELGGDGSGSTPPGRVSRREMVRGQLSAMLIS